MTNTNSTLPPVIDFRCPTCSKLYEVDSRLIKSSSPHFDCVVCGEVFCFSFPPVDWHHVETHKIGNRNSASQKIEKACPKCSALNMNSAQECYSCQVVFQNYELLKREDYPNALPSLVNLWQVYVQDYENSEKQNEFLQKCFALNQLDYAKAKMTSLKKVMGEEDTYCAQAWSELEKMFKAKSQQNQRAAQQINLKLDFNSLMKYLGVFLRQRRVLYCGPLFLALLMILFGTFSHGHRNTVGPGVAIIILHMGLIYTFKGRISLSDFIRK